MDVSSGWKLKPTGQDNGKLQKLYDTLVGQGTISRADAFLVGALVEEVDIKDLRDCIKRTQREDIKAVFESLASGSMRHLNAFVSNYENHTGKTYVAQKLPKSEVGKILNR